MNFDYTFRFSNRKERWIWTKKATPWGKGISGGQNSLFKNARMAFEIILLKTSYAFFQELTPKSRRKRLSDGKKQKSTVSQSE